jgi:hypothetical protein
MHELLETQQRRTDMTEATFSNSRHALLWAALLAAASLLFSFAIACAAPLAAFAAVAASALNRRMALAAAAAAWFANQFAGFAFLHYPADGTTLAWGVALGLICMLSCEAAGVAARNFRGATRGCAAFAAAFVVYEGAIVVITAATGAGAEHFSLATVSWIFFVNAAAFLGLAALGAAISGLLPRPHREAAPAAFRRV